VADNPAKVSGCQSWARPESTPWLAWLQLMPAGLEGAVGALRNWTFTLFFCVSELWGDVCLGLLFWGLANDTTT
jgi:ATP/ADP translocase